MGINGVISAIVTGLVIGALARIVLPGKQPIGIVLTIMVGLLGAFLGGAITAGYTQSFWITLLVQIAVAAILVAIITAFLFGRRRGHTKADESV